MRTVGDRSILDAFCIEFCKIIEKHTPYIVVSGFVAIASGRVRGTEDIDMIIAPLEADTFTKLHRDLARHGFVCVQSDDAKEIHEYLQDRLSVRYTKRDKPLPEMEVKFAKDQLDRFQLQTRTKLPLTGLPVWFSSVNFSIAFKEHYLKSEKDLEDARHLREVYKELVSEDEIRHIIRLIRKHRP